MTRWAMLAVLVVAGTFARLAPDPAPGYVLLAVAASSLVVPWRLDFSPSVQLAVSLFAGVLAIVLVEPFLSSPPVVIAGVLRNGWARLAAIALSVAVLRLFFRRPAGGAPATVGVLLIALTACGGTYSGRLFPVVCVAFVGLGMAARRASDPGRPELSSLPSRYALASAAVLAAAGACALTAAVLLPRLHEWSIHRLVRLAAPRAATGFSDRLWLGSLRGMLQSDETVLRMRGGHADHLRGVVYDRYDSGRWTLDPEGVRRIARMPARLSGSGSDFEVELVGREPDAYFVPLGITALAVETKVAMFDEAGVVRPLAASVATRVWFRRGDVPMAPPAEPRPVDLEVPLTLQAPLERLAREWTDRSSSPADRLEALEARLAQDFSYALDFERPRGVEPVLHFLQVDRRGHCEYFASAMTLLARSMGVPARVVGGYRVTERNPIGDYYVVRERNAHTWVEAFVPGVGWQTYDPTPGAELAGTTADETPFFAALIDVVDSFIDAGLRMLDALTWTELMTPLVALLFLYTALRWWRERPRGSRPIGGEPALACFERLSAALAERSVERSPAEPIECFAARLEAEPALGSLGPRASDLLMRYSALRYGGIGEEAALDRDVTTLVRRIAERQSAP